MFMMMMMTTHFWKWEGFEKIKI